MMRKDNDDDEIVPTTTTSLLKDAAANNNGYQSVPKTVDDDDDFETTRPSNEYVLNVAFVSFLGFTILQTGFALIAKSQSMLTDSEAMALDAATYMFNYVAERCKHQPRRTDDVDYYYRHKLHTLFLELVPPLISVSSLLIITILALRQALQTIADERNGTNEDSPDLQIMMMFSGLNLILDVVNVMCFARVNQATGLPIHFDYEDTETETSEEETRRTLDDDDDSHDSALYRNLNMCSAWTHVFADTLRSVAVLAAAGISALFPSILSATSADAWGAVVVSIIIIISLVPLIQGIFLTAWEIRIVIVERKRQNNNNNTTIAV